MILQCTNGRFCGAARVWAGAALLALSACADIDPAYDPVELVRDARRNVAGAFNETSTPPRVARAEPPPDEGRPYPNLASVPDRPQRMTARRREGEIRSPAAHRPAALAPDAGLRGATPIAGAPAPALEGRYVGTVIPDAIGGFGPGDERLLRVAADAQRDNDGAVRLEGEAEAGLAVADRLTALGVPRDRIETLPTVAVGPSGRMVAIFVAYEPATR